MVFTVVIYPMPALSLPIDLNETFGLSFIGLLVAAVLYGIGTSQAVVFFLKFPHESRLIKISVALVWIADTVHMIFAAHVGYTLEVTKFGNILSILLVPWSTWAAFSAESVSELIIRLFFAYRLWKLSGHSYIISVISCALTGFIFSVSIALIALAYVRIKDVFTLHQQSWIIYVLGCCIVFTDLWFAAWLVYYLSRVKRVSNTRLGTMEVLDMVIVYAVNTGLLTCVISALSVATFAKLPDSAVWEGLFVNVSKLYANAMFATLNYRSWVSTGIDGANAPIVTVRGNLAIPAAFTDVPPPEVKIFVGKEVIAKNT